MNGGARGRRRAIGLAATATLLTVLVLAGAPADAVRVDLTSPGQVDAGTSATLTLDITLQDADNHVPLTNFTVRLTDPDGDAVRAATFDTNGTRLAGDDSVAVTSLDNPAPGGTGNATVVEGNDTEALPGDAWGYGEAGTEHTVTVDIEVTDLDPGTYDVATTVRAADLTFDSPTRTLTVAETDDAGDGSSSGGGGSDDDDDSGSGSSGGGGSGSSSDTSSGGGGGAGVSGENLEDIFRRYTAMTIHPGAEGTIAFPDDSPVRRLGVTVRGSSAFDPSFVVGRYGQRPDRVEDPPGRIWGYLSITTSLLETDLESVEVEFVVELSWLDAHGLDASDVVLSRWNDDRWTDLETRVVDRTGDRVTLSATSPGLSVFAIRGDVPGAAPSQGNGDASEPRDTEPSGGSGDPDPVTDATATATAAATGTDAVSTPGFTGLAALLGVAAALLATRRR